MSGPNTEYDPVEVTPLREDEVFRMRDEALAAIAAAPDLAALKQVRTDHAGDRSPLALANREIGALPPQARKEAGKRVGQARGAVSAAFAERQTVLEAEQEERMLAEETVDVTLPWDRGAAGRPAPGDDDVRADRRRLRGHGLGGRGGPDRRGRVAQLRRPQPRPDHPARTMQDTFWTEPADNAHRAAHAHLTGAGPHHADPRAADLRDLPRAGCSAPTRTTPRTARCSTRSRGWWSTRASRWPTCKGTLDHLLGAMFGEGISTRFRPSYFPFTEPSAEVDLVCFVCRGVAPAVETCRTCRGEGWIEWGGCGVVNPRVLVACGIDPELYTGFAFGMGIDRTLMFRHGVEDLRDLFEGDVRFTAAFGTEI